MLRSLYLTRAESEGEGEMFHKLLTFSSLAGMAVLEVEACTNIIVSPGASMDTSSIMVRVKVIG